MAPPDREAMLPPAEPSIRFAFEAKLSELAPASEKIRHFLNGEGVETATIFALEMVIEEIATNAMKYGHAAPPDGTITIEATARGTSTEMVIEDNGGAFDPTEAPKPEVNLALEKMPVGGLGIHLVREVTDGFEYRRVNGCNQVRVWIDRKN